MNESTDGTITSSAATTKYAADTIDQRMSRTTGSIPFCDGRWARSRATIMVKVDLCVAVLSCVPSQSAVSEDGVAPAPLRTGPIRDVSTFSS